MTSEYHGRVVILTDSAEYPGRADLWRRQDRVPTPNFSSHTDYVGGLESWGGAVSVAEDVAWEIQHADGPRLRVVRDGDFMVTGGKLDSGLLQIRGSGPCPFD